MEHPSIVAVDLAKTSFQVCATHADDTVLYNRKLNRTRFIELLPKLPPCRVATESSSTAHHWGRMARGFVREASRLSRSNITPCGFDPLQTALR